MTSRFDGRVAMVTGAGSGIGRATAHRLASEGATVAVVDVDADAAGATASQLDDLGVRALAVAADVASTPDVTRAIEEIMAAFGRIDVLVNNAAIAQADELTSITDDSWNREIDIALGGVFRLTRAVLPLMSAAGGGVIVNVGSVNAYSAYGQEAYSAAKAGVESVTRSTAVRYAGSGIRANTVVPGTIRTAAWDARLAADADVFTKAAKVYPLRRVGEPEDVAAAIAFLASDDASWITGTSLVVDGGLIAAGTGILDLISAPRSED